ncbi:MAG: hypothetical protein JXM71_02175 [Spirochaetales bacterium]|nr:hypothetical protein [Spirochaetales bacterium]
MKKAPRFALLVAAVMACAVFSAAVFMVLLSLWGLVAAPFVRLRSSRPVMVAALALSAWATIVVYGMVYRKLARKHEPPPD